MKARFAMMALGLGCMAGPALAQRAAENVVASADDAFGSSVGNERIGIYSDTDVRGFSPVKAGNLRIEGVYFDQQGGLSGRVRSGLRIRVGIAALDYPFPAPSGIVDYSIRPSGDKRVISLGLLTQGFGGRNVELDTAWPIFEGRLSIAAGVTRNHDESADGARFINYGAGLMPRLRFDRGEVTLILSHFGQRSATSHIVVAAPQAFLPPLPEPRVYLGQDWAKGENESTNLGFISNAELGGGWSVRAGGFKSRLLKHYAYSEIFTVADREGNARHSIVADPRQVARSYSGEAQAVWRHDGPVLRHRVLFNLRGRDKSVETGGSDSRDLGPVRLGDRDPEIEPAFVFRPTDTSTIRQLTGGLGYVGRYRTLGQLNLGLQKTSYRASFRRLNLETAVKDQPWLYNAALVISPAKTWMVYAGMVRGLEESGVAPETARNRNESLPASRTRQMDAGVRFKLWTTTAMVSAFQIEKPYFSFDAANLYTVLGDVRHRGLEASVSGVAGPLTVVAGAVFMKPEVTGEARTLGRVGPRPVGVAATLIRLDTEYRLPLDGLGLTASVVHTGRRAASARPYAELGGSQLFAPAFTTVDIGARYRFKLDNHPMSARVVLANVFDNRSWRIVAANSYQINDNRRLSAVLLADF